jgi:hypothetical protein
LGTLLPLEVVGDSKVEDWSQERFLIASHEEAIEENIDLSIDGVCFGVEAVKPVDHSEDEASQDARRVDAVWRQVHVQVERFLVEGIGHSAILDGQLKVEKNCGVRSLGDFPAELAELVKVFLETLPHSAVEVFVGAVPDSEDVIDVSFVKYKKSDGQGMIGIDVSIHRDGVGCEKPSAVREIRQIFQEVSQFEGALEVGWQFFADWLKLLV